MNHDLAGFLAHQRALIEAGLRSRLPSSPVSGAARLNEAVRYALFPGGQRWRPVFTLLGVALIRHSDSRVDDDSLSVACAIEFLHTSSLIFDDLPAMDDADLRRGKPALHLVFSEAQAILVALALLNQSYALLGAVRPSEAAQKLVHEATLSIGCSGMIGGQAADLHECEDRRSSSFVGGRNLKTTALTRLMMTAGAIAAGAPDEDVLALARFGECLGLAYQVYDDLLDCCEEGPASKTARQDVRLSRPSAVFDLGVDGALTLGLDAVEEGIGVLHARFEESLARKTIVSAARHLFRGLTETRFANLPRAAGREGASPAQNRTVVAPESGPSQLASGTTPWPSSRTSRFALPESSTSGGVAQPCSTLTRSKRRTRQKGAAAAISAHASSDATAQAAMTGSAGVTPKR